MVIAQTISQSGVLTHDAVMQVLARGLGDRFTGQKVLVLIPDHTCSLPLPELFRTVVEVLHDVRELNFMVALGTHPGYSEEGLNHLVGITAEARTTTFRHVGLLNHAWNDPAALTSLGVLNQDEIKQLAGPNWHPSLPNEINIRINKAVLEHDHIIVVGPTFPHEVVGFSGGAKYLFPGISGPDVINLPHFLNDWERFKHVPLGVLAHSTHVRGSGVMEKGVEKANVKVTLASKIPPEDCARLNLGYLDPASINPADWQNREDEGIFYVAKAGEKL